jgi:hypothetical protein
MGLIKRLFDKRFSDHALRLGMQASDAPLSDDAKTLGDVLVYNADVEFSATESKWVNPVDQFLRDTVLPSMVIVYSHHGAEQLAENIAALPKADRTALIVWARFGDHLPLEELWETLILPLVEAATLQCDNVEQLKQFVDNFEELYDGMAGSIVRTPKAVICEEPLKAGKPKCELYPSLEFKLNNLADLSPVPYALSDLNIDRSEDLDALAKPIARKLRSGPTKPLLLVFDRQSERRVRSIALEGVRMSMLQSKYDGGIWHVTDEKTFNEKARLEGVKLVRHSAKLRRAKSRETFKCPFTFLLLLPLLLDLAGLL